MFLIKFIRDRLKQAVCWHFWAKEKVNERYEEGPNETLFRVTEAKYVCEKCGKIENDKTLKLA